jgi:hypothetical protein
MRNPRYVRRFAKAHRDALDRERRMHEAVESMWDWGIPDDPVERAEILREMEKRPLKPFVSRIRSRAPE